MPHQTCSHNTDEELQPAQTKERQQHESVLVITCAVELDMARGGIVCDWPPAPPTRPVVGEVAQRHLVADLHRPVFALHGALDTARGERVPCVQPRGHDARDVVWAVGETDAAVLDQHGAKGVGTMNAAYEPRGGKAVPVLGRAAQALNVTKLKEAENRDLELMRESHEGAWLLLGHLEAGSGVAFVCILAVTAPSSQLLREARGGGAGLEVEFTPRRRERLGDGDDGLTDGARDVREAREDMAGTVYVMWRACVVGIHDAGESSQFWVGCQEVAANIMGSLLDERCHRASVQQ